MIRQNPIDLAPEFDQLINVLRQEFLNCDNITRFLVTHQKISQIYSRRLQQQLDKIPELRNKQVKEININASPEVKDLVNALKNAGTTLNIDEKSRKVM